MNKKTKLAYVPRDWKSYNTSLVRRGSLEIWLAPGFEKRWLAGEAKRRGPGAAYVYSDTAILLILQLREVFQLQLRQTEGFVRSLLRLMGEEELPVPDYTTLCVRQRGLRVRSVRRKPGEKMVVAMDSTGLKVYGEGEWKVKIHEKSKRRTWRKLHIVLDVESQEILGWELTENGVHDSEVGERLLQDRIREGLNLKGVCGDGGYDRERVYRILEEHPEIEARIPPQKNAKIKRHGNCQGPPHPRDKNLRQIRKLGRKAWKKQIGYHRRSLAETAMYRLKVNFGDRLKNRDLEHQRTEVALRIRALNRMTALGLPQSLSLTA